MKEHDRCGSHLVAPMLTAAALGNVAVRRAGLRGPAAEAVVGLGSAAVAVEVFAWSERHPTSALTRLLRRPGHEIQRAVGHARADGRAARGRARGAGGDPPGRGRAGLTPLRGLDPTSSACRSSASASGYYSDAYFNFTRQLLQERGRHPRVTMQVFQKRESCWAASTRRSPCSKLCSDDWDAARGARALRGRRDRADGDGDDDRGRLLAVRPPRDRLPRLPRAPQPDHAQRARGRRGRARQADPVLPRAPRPLARADRRRLGRPRGRRDRGVHRRAGLLVGRARRRHRPARPDRRLRRRHGRGLARPSPTASPTR